MKQAEPEGRRRKRRAEWNKTLAKVLAELGHAVEVKGDGRCWQHAWSASLKFLHDAASMPEEDMLLQDALLLAMQRFVEDGKLPSVLKDEFAEGAADGAMLKSFMELKPMRKQRARLEVEAYNGSRGALRVAAAFSGMDVVCVSSKVLEQDLDLVQRKSLVRSTTPVGLITLLGAEGVFESMSLQGLLQRLKAEQPTVLVRHNSCSGTARSCRSRARGRPRQGDAALQCFFLSHVASQPKHK